MNKQLVRNMSSAAQSRGHRWLAMQVEPLRLASNTGNHDHVGPVGLCPLQCGRTSRKTEN